MRKLDLSDEPGKTILRLTVSSGCADGCQHGQACLGKKTMCMLFLKKMMRLINVVKNVKMPAF
jgi:hypothetical protein